MNKLVTVIKRFLMVLIPFFMIGFILPETPVIPVKNATPSDWNKNTFWYTPWGKSGVHKGIDIFAAEGTPVLSATSGVVLYAATIKRGGKVLAILGPGWRVHYYAHLGSAKMGMGNLVSTAEVIGSVGTSGNAKGKPPHLHYTVVTLVPYLWRWDSAIQGWKKIFYLNPAGVYLSVK